MVMKVLCLMAIMFAGGVLQSVTGFGLSVYAICLVPLLMPMKQAVVLVSLMAGVVSLQIFHTCWRSVDLRVMLPATLTSLVTQYMGFLLLNMVEEGILKRILGVLLILLSIYQIRAAGGLRIRACWQNGMIAGAISGLLTGMYNIGGPPLVIYYLCACEDKRAYTASLQASFIVNIAIGLAMHAARGNVTADVLCLSAAGVIAVLPGGWLGMKIFNRLDRAMLNKIVYVFLMAMGVLQLIL